MVISITIPISFLSSSTSLSSLHSPIFEFLWIHLYPLHLFLSFYFVFSNRVPSQVFFRSFQFVLFSSARVHHSDHYFILFLSCKYYYCTGIQIPQMYVRFYIPTSLCVLFLLSFIFASFFVLSKSHRVFFS